MFFGFIVVMVWEGCDVVKIGCVFFGVINFFVFVFGIICGDFVIDVGCNVCYGFDFVENVKKEIVFWFKFEEFNSYKVVVFDWVYEKV